MLLDPYVEMLTVSQQFKNTGAANAIAQGDKPDFAENQASSSDDPYIPQMLGDVRQVAMLTKVNNTLTSVFGGEGSEILATDDVNVPRKVSLQNNVTVLEQS